jgi:AraC-like DNA-binding protein
MVHDPETVRYPDSGLLIAPKKVIFMGPHCKVIHRYPGKRMLGFQVIFQPGAVYQITNVSAHELTNLYVDGQDVFGSVTALVNEELFHAHSYTAMISIVERFLTSMISKKNMRKHRVDQISKAMIQEHERFDLNKFLNDACLSHRQLDRKFKEWVGIAPKTFLQMSRFDKAFRMKNRLPQKDWLSIALHSGYYDYQHLVRDYKIFTGYTPTQFFEIENGAPERSLGDVEI